MDSANCKNSDDSNGNRADRVSAFTVSMLTEVMVKILLVPTVSVLNGVVVLMTILQRNLGSS